VRNSIREHDLTAQLRVRYLRMEQWDSDDAYRTALEVERQMMIQAQSLSMRMIYLLDFGPAFQLSARQRQIQSDWLRAIEALEREVTLGKAFVTASFVFRGMITAINWLSPPAVPCVVAGTTREALIWIFDLSERNSVPVSPAKRSECSVSFGLGAFAHNEMV
jgi:hypothetical protein